MTYATRAALTFDSTFRDRVIACAREQALIFKDDGRPDIAALAESIIESSSNAHGLVDNVVMAPNFVDVEDGSTVEDPEILAAVQAAWPVYAGVLYGTDAPPADG
jgi:hypothetical protein